MMIWSPYVNADASKRGIIWPYIFRLNYREKFYEVNATSADEHWLKQAR